MLTIVLSACSDNNGSTALPGGVAVATIAPDYSSSSHAVVSLVNEELIVSSNLLPIESSDITMAAGGSYFYRIERAFSGNNITKFSFETPQDVIWQYSLRDDPEELVAANPVDMVVVNETKAYVIRRGKNVVWIVNPSAETEEEFKIGELDLSAYADSDGKPEMHKALIAGGKLFIVMQRLVNNDPSETAYVAVFDIATDMEIETSYPGDSVKGIPLQIKNPQSDMVYVNTDNSIYIAAVGSYLPTVYTGGIEKIDVNTYDTSVVLDDGTAEDHPYDKITAVAVVSPTLGYFISCADCDVTLYPDPSFTDYSLFKFNPGTGVASAIEIIGLQNSVLAGLALSPSGELWISAGDATLYVMETSTDSLVDTLDVFLNPNQVVFER